MVLILFSEDIRQRVFMLSKIYNANQNEETVPYSILMKWSRFCLLFAKWGCIPCGASMGILILWPFVDYFLTGVLEPILPNSLPFVDEHTTTGFIIHYSFEFCGCVLAMSGTCTSDFMLIILIIHMWPLCLIFQNMFRELNLGLLEERNRSSQQMRDHFRNIIMVHGDMCWLAKN